MVVNSVIGRALELGATCKESDRKGEVQKCEFSDSNFSLSLLVENRKERELMFSLSLTVGYWFPPRDERIRSWGDLSEKYLTMEEFILASLPSRVTPKAARGYNNNYDVDQVPWTR